MFKEHSMVRLLDEVDGVPKGTVGCIVDVLLMGKAYDVEVELSEDNVRVVTVMHEDLEKTK